MTLSSISGGRALAFWGLVVSFPGNTMKLSSAPFTSETGGHFSPKVLSWGGLNYQISDRSGRLNAVETRVTVADVDRTIARIVSGASSGSVRGSAAVMYLMTPSVASSSWTTVFSGKVAKVSFPRPLEAEITIRTDDDQLQRISPRGGWALTRVQWPNAKPEVYDKYAPIIYGYHDMGNLGVDQGGMVPTLYVDTVAWRYLVCAGKAKTITRVYVNGVSTVSGWSTSYITRSGRIYTTILFTADQADAEITVDLQGYEDVGDGSGTIITNPATQFAHRLTNFCLGDWMTGSWLSTNALIDSTYLSAAESYFTSLGAAGSHYDDDKRTGLDILSKFCNTWRMRSWWTLSGTVAIGYENVFALPYTGTRWRYYRDEVRPLALYEDDFRMTSRILCRSALNSVGGTYMQTLEVVDASVSSDTQDALDLELSEAK